MIILGLNAFHADAAAAILRDGVLVAAAEEERFRRLKHWAGFPSEAIRYCLREARIRLADVDHIAVNQDNRARVLRKIGYLAAHPPRPRLLGDRLAQRRDRQRVPERLDELLPADRFRGRMHKVEHHLAHLASAFHVSPFDEAVVASIDGFGDFASATWGLGRGAEIDIAGEVLFPHSLGIFFQALTQYLGFPYYGDEYKVMGLAAYGAPAFLNEMGRIVTLQRDGAFALDLRFFRHHREPIAEVRAEGRPEFAALFSPALEALLGPRRRSGDAITQRHRDIACSAQAMYEMALCNLLRTLHQRYGLSDLALAGGCAMNSAANGKIRRETRFRRLFVQPAAGDAGGAVGAAFAVWHRLGGKRSFVMEHAYWGPHFNPTPGAAALSEGERAGLAEAGFRIVAADERARCREAADAIAAGRVIGWCQGRMEWGPRALGNRSILGDPRRADMKEVLNAKIKRRESFRPFAPSILAESVGEWFDEDEAVPFMMQTLQVREEKRALIPAVTHVDGSARLQTVTRAANPPFYRLIEEFRTRTGIPMVLNTSFNENEPIVCTASEALDCFRRSEMDLLVIGDTIVSREPVSR